MEVKIDADELCELKSIANKYWRLLSENMQLNLDHTMLRFRCRPGGDVVIEERDKARAAAEFWKQKAYDMLEVAEIRRDLADNFATNWLTSHNMTQRHDFDSDEGKF